MKNQVKLGLLKDPDTMVNSKYMKDYDSSTIIIPCLLWCQQSMWIGIVRKVACRWLKVE